MLFLLPYRNNSFFKFTYESIRKVYIFPVLYLVDKELSLSPHEVTTSLLGFDEDFPLVN